MAIALVTNTAKGTAQNGGTTNAIDTTGANLIVVAIAYFSGTISSISDSKSNTWTALTNAANGSNEFRLFYCLNPTVGSGHTFTVSASSQYPTICVAAFSGVKTASAFDQQSAVGSTNPGSVTPTEDNELVVTGLCGDCDATSTYSGFTVTNAIAFTGGSFMGGAMAYKVQTTATTVNTAWSATGSVRASGIATFKAEPAAGQPAAKRMGGVQFAAGGPQLGSGRSMW